jgi:Tfp pilus assembly protein PilE
MMHLSQSKSKLELVRARGFTLILALIFTSVVLTVGLALADVAYKQVLLASAARQSEYAFYAADSALECALYQDQKLDMFNYGTTTFSGSFICQNLTVNYSTSPPISNSRITIFNIPCASGGSQASLSIQKNSNGTAILDASGFNNCNAADPNRVERGVKASY